MTTYTSHGLPKYDTTDLIADGTTNLRTSLNQISTTANNALSGVEARANAYADDGDTATLTSAKTYADGGDSTTLTAAKGYADSGDTSTLNAAKQHADSGDASTLATAKTYTDTTVTEANPPGQIDIGTVTTLDAGAQATADIVTTSPGINELSLGLVRGYPGYNATGAAQDDAAIAAFIREDSGYTETGEAIHGPTPSGDDTTSLNAILAANAGGEVKLRAGAIYNITDSLTVPSRTVFNLNGATLDATGMPDAGTLDAQPVIRAAGSTGATATGSQPIPANTQLITGISDTTGFAAGDLILLTNNELHQPGISRPTWLKGELNQIVSVDSATQITVATGALFDYAVDGITLTQIAPVKDVVVKNGNIIAGGVDSAHLGVSIDYAVNPTVEDVRITGAEDKGVRFAYVWRGTIAGCYIRDCTSPSFANTGYGTVILDGSRYVDVAGNYYDNCRHAVAGGGSTPTTHVNVTGNHAQGCTSAALESHGPSYYWAFTDNTVFTGTTAILLRGQRCMAARNRIFDMTNFAIEANTYNDLPNQYGMVITGNRIQDCIGGVKVDGRAGASESESLRTDVEITLNTIENSGPTGILLGNFDGAVVSGNNVRGNTSEGIRVVGLSGSPSRNLTLAGNRVEVATGRCIQINDVVDITMDGGSMSGTGQFGLYLTACHDVSITGGILAFDGTYAVRLAGCFRLNFTGVNVRNAALAPCVRATDCEDLTFTGGYYAAAAEGIFTTTTNYVVVTGANLRNSDPPSIDAVSQVVANNLL